MFDLIKLYYFNFNHNLLRYLKLAIKSVFMLTVGQVRET